MTRRSVMRPRGPLATVMAGFLLVAGPAAAYAVCSVTTACSATPFLSDPSCCPGTTTCTLDGVVTLSGPTCVLDFQGRALTVSGRIVVGSASLRLQAGSVRVTGSLDAQASTSSTGGNVIVTTTGGASVAFALSGSGPRILLGGERGGAFTLQADGPVSLAGGGIDGSSPDDGRVGGTVTIETSDGDVDVQAPINAGSGDFGGGGMIAVRAAGDVRVGSGIVLDANGGEEGAGDIMLEAGGEIAVAPTARLQANGLAGSAGFGGTLDLLGGSLLLEGELQASGASGASGFGGDGGHIAVEARSGALTLRRTTLGIVLDAGVGGIAGDLQLTTLSPTGGTLTLDMPVSARGPGSLSDEAGGGGNVEAFSAATLVVTKSIDLSGSGEGAGFLDLVAQGDVTVTGAIASADPFEGGEVEIESGGDTILGGAIDMTPASGSLGGEGGELRVMSAGDLLAQQSFELDVSATAAAGIVTLEAGGDVTVSAGATIRANGLATGAPGGELLISAGAGDRAGNLLIEGAVAANGHSSNSGSAASIRLNGCAVTIAATGLVDSTGDRGSANRVTGRTGLTVNGRLLATQSNVAILPVGVVPTVAGQVSPTFAISSRAPCTGPNTPDGCLVPCAGGCRLDVDGNGSAAFGTDAVYIARRLLGLTVVPPSFRTRDPNIPPDSVIAARIDAAGTLFDVDARNGVAFGTDAVYIARRLLGLVVVPPSFRTRDPSIPPDTVIAPRIDALCPAR